MLRSRRLAMLAVLVAGCSVTSAPEGTTTTAADASTTTTQAPPPSPPPYRGFDASGALDGTLVVILGEEEIPVYTSPDESEPYMFMPRTTILGTTTVLTTTGPPRDGWVEVMLPVRPTDHTGWVKVEDVAMYVVNGRIVVDLTARELVYYVGDEVALRSPVAVGTARNPTPTGTYFVTDNVKIVRSNGPWGPAALGLSARSDTITEFNGGDGIIGIHGTNRPGSIGQAASLGCVRLPNDVIMQLHEMVPIGTPVKIEA